MISKMIRKWLKRLKKSAACGGTESEENSEKYVSSKKWEWNYLRVS
jgi:hypothetical protein